MSGASQSQPGNRAALSACCNACDVTCCPSGACASTVGSSSKSITSTNPRSAMSHRPSPLNPGSALRSLWSSWCDPKAPNYWPRLRLLSLFEMYWALCLSWWQRDPVLAVHVGGKSWRARPCACPGGNALQWGLCGAQRSHPNQDKHKAPSSTLPRPLSLQDPGPQAPQWIGFPDSVVNIHQGNTLPVKARELRRGRARKIRCIFPSPLWSLAVPLQHGDP